MTGGRRPALGSYVYAAVAIAVAVGLGFVALGEWQAGTTVAGVAMLAAGMARAALPERLSGLLRIRRRASDTVLMLCFGAALVALAVLVPTPG